MMNKYHFHPIDACHYLGCRPDELDRICEERRVPFIEEGGIRYYEYGPEIVALKRVMREKGKRGQLNRRAGRQLLVLIIQIVITPRPKRGSN
jgi:hypothetical protein